MQNDDNKKQEIVNALTNIEIAPIIKRDETKLNDTIKIPFVEMNLIGAGLTSLSSSLNTITTTVSTPASGLYRICTDGKIGTLVTKNGACIGNMVGADGHTFSGRAVFYKVDSNLSTVTTTVPFDPLPLMSAVMLVYISQKLDTIEETQQEILNFLKTDKKSKLESNITFLLDVFNNYKFNWDNNTYKTNMHVKVLDVRQESEHGINFAQKQISALMQKRNNSSSKVEAIVAEFENYQLALYAYGFSSFLEVLLLNNFDENYLNHVVKKIEDYSYQYRELYTKSYELLENASKNSVESAVLSGLSKISGAVGNAVAKTPVISKSQIDENLIRAHDKLEKAKETRIEKCMEPFISSKNNYVYPFVKAINAVNTFYNQSNELYFDADNLYIAMPN